MKKFFGSRAFYRTVFTLAVPFLLQNAISTFVNLLDNLMVGRVGTEPMSGVAIVNQILFVYNLCLFGGSSGAGIFSAQFHGRGDVEGQRSCLRYNLILLVGFTCLALAILLPFGDELIGTFLHGEKGNLSATLSYGHDYLRCMLPGLLPFAVTNAYTSILRAGGESSLPMKASVSAIIVNLVFNWILIFGKLGCPALGVKGAAIATVLSRYVEAFLIVFFSHRNKNRYPYTDGLMSTLKIPVTLLKKISVKGLPLLLNEMFWSLGQTVLNQCYSLRGLTAVAALNINSVVQNLFNTVFLTLGNCVGILLGNALGSGDFQRAKEDCPRLIALSFFAAGGCAALMALASPYIPLLYNTLPEVQELAGRFMQVCALMIPLHAITNASYFTLRSGGRTMITILFDSAFTWATYVPCAEVLARCTSLPVLWIFAIVNAIEIIKATIGILLVKKGIWIRNIIETEAQA